jgi:hypothetical protein
MLFNDSQLESQDRSILSNFDPFSKIILSMWSNASKHDFPKLSIFSAH